MIPGETLSKEQGYVQGHGSYMREEEIGVPALISALAGRIERVNKLITVNATRSRYAGQIGDLVVGIVSRVETRRWKVDLRGQKDAALMLSSVHLPGGVQRMRTEAGHPFQHHSQCFSNHITQISPKCDLFILRGTSSA